MEILLRNATVIFILFFTAVCISLGGRIPALVPGDKAPSFTLQTYKDRVLSYDAESYKGSPLLFLIFTNESCFLESLFSRPRDFFTELFENSPDNAHYVFIFQDVFTAFKGANPGKRLQDEFILAASSYSASKLRNYPYDRNRSSPVVPTTARRRVKRFGHPSTGATQTPGGNVGPPKKILFIGPFRREWLKRVHFATFPVHKLGNWIPRYLSRWGCTGLFCGFDQIAIENQEGFVQSVFRRLDTRYSWLPPISTLTAKYSRLPIVSIADACASRFPEDVRGSLALVFMETGSCSVFSKVKNSQSNGALGVIVVARRSGLGPDLNCHGNECEQLLTIPATMIPNGDRIFALSQASGFYARFQTTPSDAFVFGIDGQGRVQQTDWFLFPSSRFLAYQAQWFNYLTDCVYNVTGEARIIEIFSGQDLHGAQGIVNEIALPSYDELQLYRNVELDMSVSCPGTGPDACTHWDHVIRLYVSCNPSEKPGPELGRWIMAFKRRSNNWLTPVTPLLPLLKCNSSGGAGCRCNFTVKTEAWVMPWTIRLKIRLSDKMKHNANYTTWRSIERTLVPTSKTTLFSGRLFDENYNKAYSPKQFVVPPRTARVKLVATITGHGRDNNDCAGACITSHHFVVNSNHVNTRIFKSARSAPGCADRKVLEGFTREDLHSAWLFGREGWCDGQEVIPWVVDITNQVRYGQGVINTISYHGRYNGTDPKPMQDPGIILMSSYVVYYEYRDV